jgi:ribosome-binding factor A
MSRREKEKFGAGLVPEIGRPAGKQVRRLRVEGELQREIWSAVAALADPRLEGVSVTRVELTEDLRFARIYVRVSFGEDSAASRARIVKVLTATSGRMRGEMGRALGLRHAPELRFVYDEGPDAAQRVDELLAEIHRDESGSSS